ncbi:NAD-dependent protein deacylase [Paenibacillus alvei]|uniref:NAD-dependent protein deacetylase n=1 Tax=Paenibacillus alvei TaxID=44250 RepID=A0ABT4H339_PAEAL|nr:MULTISPECIES: NAD-dependent protein deacylase [Paenibacillus]MCY7483889.1 NAD-dependent protein deacylase [Paenibacillus alvei]MCY9541505.1 NAD-dependent protein deacylase [Paenibacillus alvei]MCY9705277.1 NAD-dependent protein deacylase [Paenibacillus alvei]MCY9735005.1 NAD-dependent protein deacylase [Paenibacillus alvei]MCY9754252.1 NAD-dependent protein deacylase [Paenibacillus alvei]
MTEQKNRNHHAHAEELADLLRSSKHVVFFGGAGTSTESGIPDFRSDNGVFADDEAFRYPPEVMLSRSFYDRDPATFYRFYRAKMLHPAAKPNAAHRALARLEEDGIVSAVVTQNIDGLHQSAGSREVWELHGSVHRNRCTRCGAIHGLDAVLESEEIIPSCKQCSGTLKPDVVLYEESLDDKVISGAIGRIQEADLLIVGGTSLTVHPAASFVQLAKKAKLVLMNRTATTMDGRADAVYREPMGELFAAAYYKLTGKEV